MSSVITPLFKTLSMVDTSLLSFPSILTSKNINPFLVVSSKPMKLRILCAHSSQFLLPLSLKKTNKWPSIVSFVAQTSDWAQQEDITLTYEQEQNEPMWENEGLNDTEARSSDWEVEGGDSTIEASESSEDGVFVERDIEDEEGYVEPPEEAKIFVGNLPYDVDSHKLATTFEKAGVVEIAEVIYNRETDQSRGFGFVTMSTVEEADKAVEMFNRVELDGRLLTVNKASARGTHQERPPSVFEPAFRIYVGNLPWDVDNVGLEQIFSKHGKVLQARMVSDRETGRSRGFGFVTMSSEAEMNNAIAALDGQSVGGRAIRVNVAEERSRRSSF